MSAPSSVASVTNYFASPNEGFTTTLGSTIASAATTVPLNSVTGLTNASIFVGIIEPGGTNEQVFTGTVDTGGSQVTGVVWTRGTNVGHTSGVTIVDYVTGTVIKMLSAGILKQHKQSGAHSAVTADSLVVAGNGSVGGTFLATGAATHSSTTALTGAVSGAGYSLATIKCPYKFSGNRGNAANTGNGSYAVVAIDTMDFDTGTNVSSGVFTAPINGFYHFDGSINVGTGTADCTVALFKNGSEFKRGGQNQVGTNVGFTVGCIIQLSATDTVDMRAYSSSTHALNINPYQNWFSGHLVSAT